MGLQERRIIQAYQQEKLPGELARVRAAAGFEVEIEVDWETIQDDDHVGIFEMALPKVYFDPLVGALEAVAVDAMGKEALASGLKKIVITNASKAFSPNGFSFADGVLTLDHRPTANTREFEARQRRIQLLLEEGL